MINGRSVQNHKAANEQRGFPLQKKFPRDTAPVQVLPSLPSTFHQHCSHCCRADVLKDWGRYVAWRTQLWISRSSHFSNRRFDLSDSPGRIQRLVQRIQWECGIDDLGNRLSAKLSNRILLRTLLSAVGGSCARSLT